MFNGRLGSYSVTGVVAVAGGLVRGHRNIPDATPQGASPRLYAEIPSPNPEGSSPQTSGEAMGNDASGKKKKHAKDARLKLSTII